MKHEHMRKTPINSYSLFSIIRGVFIMLFIWPVMIPLAFRDWQIKRGYRKRLPIDGGVAIVMTIVSVPFTIILYALIAILWYSSKQG